MKTKMESCDREAAVLAAVASGAWDAGLREHARRCVSCQDAIDIWRYLQMEAQQIDADLDASGVELPHPGLIWWRRRILDQHAAARRVLTPITLLPYVAGALLFVVLAALALWQWDAVAAALADTPTSAASAPAVAVSSAASSSSSAFTASLTTPSPLAMLALALAASVPIAWSVASAWYLWSRK
jgi:hypothetical protein